MRWWVSPLPWLVPGVVLAFLVSTLASGRVARWLGVRRPVAWVLIMSAGVILAGTMTPLVAADRSDLSLVLSCDLSRIGLAGIDQLRWPSDVTGNILMFIPLGFAIALVPRSRRKAAVLATAVALPFLIEGTQLVVAPLHRACQSADVVDNLTGLAIGLAAGTVVGLLVPTLGRRVRPDGSPSAGVVRGDGPQPVPFRGMNPAPDPDRDALEAVLAGRGEYELFPCDPVLADTAAFCAHYGFAMEDSANTIVVVGKGPEPVYAACVVLATHRLAVNQVIKARWGRRSSFATPDETRAITGHEIGGVTVFGLPADLPVWVDGAVMTRERIVLGGGSRSWKVIAPPSILLGLPNAVVIEGLANAAPPREG